MEAGTQRGDERRLLAELRGKGLPRDAIHAALMEAGLSRDEAEEAVDGDGTFERTLRQGRALAAGVEDSSAGPEGIAGWLMLPAIWLPLQAMIGMAGVTEAALTLNRLGADEAHLLRMTRVQGAGELLGLVLTLLCLVLFFKRKAATPPAVVALSLYALALGLLLILLAGRDGPVLAYAPSLAQGVPFSVILIVYFLTSVRVKNTFVR